MNGDLVNSGFSLAAIATLIAIVVGLVGLSLQQRRVRRENERDAQERTDRLMTGIEKTYNLVEDRLREVEITIRDFMPRTEIEQKIDHLKTNRLLAEEQLRRITDSHSTAIGRLEVGFGKLEERHDGAERSMTEIKDLVKEMRADLKAGLRDIGKAMA